MVMQVVGQGHSHSPHATQRSLPFSICTSTGIPRLAGGCTTRCSGKKAVKAWRPRAKLTRLRSRWALATQSPTSTAHIECGPTTLGAGRTTFTIRTAICSLQLYAQSVYAGEGRAVVAAGWPEACPPLAGTQ